MKLSNCEIEIQRTFLDKSSEYYLFKSIPEDAIWVERLLSFLQSLTPKMFCGCLILNASDLMHVFDLRHLSYTAKSEDNKILLQYLEMLPGYRENEVISEKTQHQHLFLLMTFASVIYLKNTNHEINFAVISSSHFYALTHIFNIIDKEYPDTLNYESWFRGLLS